MIGKDTTVNILYSIRNDTYEICPGYYFPEYGQDSALLYGYSPFTKEKIKEISENKCFVWVKKFQNTIPVVFDTTFIYQRIYTQNIKRYEIFFFIVENNMWYKKEFKVSFEKYQLPLSENISTWKPLDKIYENNILEKQSELISGIFRKQYHIAKMAVLVEQIDPLKKFDFVIGDFSISDRFVKQIEFIHPFFDQLVKKKSSEKFEVNSLSYNRSYPIALTPFTYYYFDKDLSGQFQVVLDSGYSEIKALKETFYHIFDKYPFYSERGMNKDEILKQFLSRTENDTVYYKMVRDIKNLVNEFYDPHFYVPNVQSKGDKTNPEEKISPLRVSEFYNELYISAVFDTTLADFIYPGMKVIKIEGKPSNNVINNSASAYTGTEAVRRQKAIALLMNNLNHDSTHITLVDEKMDTINTTIHYNKNNIRIPSNFKAEHCKFRIYNQNIAYFRLNNFIRGDWIRFLNHADELKNMKGIIFDLRNNGGGEEAEAIRMASCFIRDPKVYSHEEFAWNDQKKIKETLMIHPNSHLDLSNLKVIILGNERTACASEMFINFMQRNHDALLVSNSNTAGTYASIFQISFPSGFSCNINCLAKLLSSEGKVIENKGIEPDVWVQLNMVKDLAPYNDKMLQTAIAILNTYSTINILESQNRKPEVFSKKRY